MWSLEVIKSLSEKAAYKSRRLGRVPYVIPDQEMIETFRRNGQVPFCFLGDYCPEGWEMIDTLFCDSSGWGSESEPALTFNQMCDRLKPGLGYAVIEQGQFQCYVGVFRKLTGENK